ncbi:SAV_2336 N-terminal domain-related protein [Streptomyces sp. NPDC048442]|uniref:SAV_2336 N-terminal domain-related protein n=1 Tax=Streptomyces sp. NPDC048442 TaxID=3154823 RepID=UPI00343C9D90
MAGRRHVLADGDRINSGASTAQLTSLIAGLHELGIDPHPDELADALWLARWAPAVHPERAAERGGPSRTGQDRPGSRALSDGARLLAEVTPPRGIRLPAALTAELAVSGPGPAPGRGADGEDPAAAEEAASGRVRVPVAAALPQPLALQRALRPLRSYRAPARSAAGPDALDEQATADRAADTGIVVPVLRGSRRRAARVQFVMDVSTSMVVWEETLQELRQICERSGAFREVRVHYVRENADGDAAVALSAAPGAPLHRAEELRDPTGHRLTFVLSDCAGPLWRSGKMQQLLHGWASTAPVAVVQPLPQRMWRRTHLPAIQGELVRGEGPAGRLAFHPAVGAAPGPDALPVPVLAPRPGPLRAWVRLVSGATGQSLYAVAGWVRAHHPASVAPRRTDREASPADRVRAFRRAASPAAARLAVYLAAAPLVLPVMQLVQRAMLPDSGPEVLAEVMLGGLLRRGGDVEDLIGYEFIGGVRAELLEQIAVSDAHLVLKHCSAYLESRYGRTARNFPALAAAYLAGEAREAPPGRPGAVEEDGLRAFARVSADVLRRFGQTVPVAPAEVTATGEGAGELAVRARVLLDRYTARHTSRDLDEAIALLRGAVAGSPEPGGLWAEIGAALHLRWEARRTVEDLRGALEAFARTETGSLSTELLVRWHAALLAVAAEVEAAGLDAAALPDFVREQERGTHPVQRVLVGLYRQAVRCLREAEANRRFTDRGTYVEMLDALAEMAAWGADPAFAGLLEEEYGGPGQWTARMLDDAVETAVNWEYGDATGRLEHSAGLLLGSARHLLGRGEVRWEPGPGHRETGRQLAGRAVEAYRELIAGLDRARGGAPAASSASSSSGEGSGFSHEDPASGSEAPGQEILPYRTGGAEGAEGAGYGEDSVVSGSSVAGGHVLDSGGPDPAPAPPVGPDGTDRRLVHACLGLDFALRLYAEGTPDADADAEAERLPVLRRALSLTGDDRALRTLALQQLAWALADAYARTGNRDYLVEEIDAWWSSLAGLDRDGGFSPYALESLGDALIQAEEWDDAVRMMRAAVDNTSEDDPEMPGRRMALGHALLTRYLAREGQSDLHEADWMLGAAARGSEGTEIAAGSWQLRAKVAEEQARRSRSAARWNDAADYYRRAAENAGEAGRPEVEADATRHRARVLERIAGPARALTEYQKALQLYAELGQQESPGATEAQAAVRRLDPQGGQG